MNNLKYILQPYRGISTRRTCPACGGKLEFTLYIDASTGAPIHNTVGKCNRELKCGYHYTPSQYFGDNPDQRAERLTNYKPVEMKKETVFLPDRFIPSGDNLENNNLYRFFVSRFGEAESKRVFSLYRVGSSHNWKNNNGYSAAFPQIDVTGKLRQIKVIAYNPETGKRLHKEDPAERRTKSGYTTDTTQDKVWFAGKTLLENYEANLQQCFFGEHLVKDADRICIVESEKTAMIASICLPDSVWIATGGKNGCKWTSFEVCRVLTGKFVVLYPDLKCFDEWSQKAEALRKQGLRVTVSRYLEDRAAEQEKEKGLDIADYLLADRSQLMPDQNTDKGLPKMDTPTQQQIDFFPSVKNACDQEFLPTNKKEPQPLLTIGDLIEYAAEVGVLSRIKVNVPHKSK